MGNPPLFTGGVKDIAALPFPPAAETEVGAPGTVAGVALAVAGIESPTELVATIEKV